MKTASATDINARFNTYLKASENGPVVVTKKGKPVAVLLALEDEDELERLILAYSPKFQAILNKGYQQIRETGGIRHEDFWQEMEAESKV
jgi:prevent-host-death family protein